MWIYMLFVTRKKKSNHFFVKKRVLLLMPNYLSFDHFSKDKKFYMKIVSIISNLLTQNINLLIRALTCIM